MDLHWDLLWLPLIPVGYKNQTDTLYPALFIFALHSSFYPVAL